MVKEMKCTEHPYDELPEKLEEMLRSGWAFLISDDNVTQVVEMKIEPEEFIVVLIPGIGPKPKITSFVLVKVAAVLGRMVPDQEKIRALWCEWKINRVSGSMDFGVLSVAYEDDEIEALVERVLEE